MFCSIHQFLLIVHFSLLLIYTLALYSGVSDFSSRPGAVHVDVRVRSLNLHQLCMSYRVVLRSRSDNVRSIQFNETLDIHHFMVVCFGGVFKSGSELNFLVTTMKHCIFNFHFERKMKKVSFSFISNQLIYRIPTVYLKRYFISF